MTFKMWGVFICRACNTIQNKDNINSICPLRKYNEADNNDHLWELFFEK